MWQSVIFTQSIFNDCRGTISLGEQYDASLFVFQQWLGMNDLKGRKNCVCSGWLNLQWHQDKHNSARLYWFVICESKCWLWFPMLLDSCWTALSGACGNRSATRFGATMKTLFFPLIFFVFLQMWKAHLVEAMTISSSFPCKTKFTLRFLHTPDGTVEQILTAWVTNYIHMKTITRKKNVFDSYTLAVCPVVAKSLLPTPYYFHLQHC